MRVTTIKNVHKKRITVETRNGMQVSLPPGQSFDDLDVTNLKKLGDKVTYTADLTEVGDRKKRRNLAVLHG